MAYIPLRLASSTPPIVQRFIDLAIERRLLVEARELLVIAPLRRSDAPIHFWHAPTHLLLSVISGVSVTLYDPRAMSGAAFKGLLRDLYPWHLEPGFAKDASGVLADTLYDVFRNPAVHALSIAMEEQRLTRGEVARWLFPGGYRIRFRMRLLGDESEVRQLEELSERPENLDPTLSSVGQLRELDLTALYWGIRKMIESLTQDQARMEAAEVFLGAGASNDFKARR